MCTCYEVERDERRATHVHRAKPWRGMARWGLSMMHRNMKQWNVAVLASFATWSDWWRLNTCAHRFLAEQASRTVSVGKPSRVVGDQVFGGVQHFSCDARFKRMTTYWCAPVHGMIDYFLVGICGTTLHTSSCTNYGLGHQQAHYVELWERCRWCLRHWSRHWVYHCNSFSCFVYSVCRLTW